MLAECATHAQMISNLRVTTCGRGNANGFRQRRRHRNHHDCKRASCHAFWFRVALNNTTNAYSERNFCFYQSIK